MSVSESEVMMMKQCPQCGKPAADNERFCGKCGMSLDITPVSEQPVIQPKKKSKKGLLIGIISGVVVLLAAAAFILWTFVFNPDIAIKSAFQKQLEAGKNGDYETSFNYSYAPVFGGENELEKELKDFKEFIKLNPDAVKQFNADDRQLLSITPLSSDSVSSIKSTLKQHGYLDTDAIEDVKAVMYEYRNEEEEAGKQYQIRSCLAIKVHGKWYFNFVPLDEDAPGKSN